jgi:hypothetical protein
LDTGVQFVPKRATFSHFRAEKPLDFIDLSRVQILKGTPTPYLSLAADGVVIARNRGGNHMTLRKRRADKPAAQWRRSKAAFRRKSCLRQAATFRLRTCKHLAIVIWHCFK